MKHVRDTPRPLPADIPPAVRAIVDRALAKDPAARWPTAAAMAAVARQAASSLTTADPPAGRERFGAGQPAAVGRAVAVNRPPVGRTAVQSSALRRPGLGWPSRAPGRRVRPAPPYPPVPTPGFRWSRREVPHRCRRPNPRTGRPRRPPVHQPAARPESTGGSRQVFIVLVVLALLVLLCAGVIRSC